LLLSLVSRRRQLACQRCARFFHRLARRPIRAITWRGLQSKSYIILDRDQLARHLPMNVSASFRTSFIRPNFIRTFSYALFQIAHFWLPWEVRLPESLAFAEVGGRGIGWP
jgi:hypothetical protein